MKMKKPKLPTLSGANRQNFQSGAMATLISVLVLVLAVLLNVVVRAIPSQNTEFDLSDAGIYTLSEASESLAAGLEQQVQLYYLAQTGSEDANVTRLLDRYAGAGSKLSWQQVDPAIDPSFANQYNTDGTLTSGSIIVVCGDKSRVVAAADLYEYDYSSYYTTGSYSVNFDAENAIDTALLYVTSAETQTIYQISGHGELALSSSITGLIESQNLAVQSLSLIADGIPEDAAALVLNAPSADLSSSDVELLADYLAGGGSLLVTTDPSVETPNLDGLLAEYGLSRVEGIVVEGDASYCMRGYSHYLLPKVESTEATTGMDGFYVLAPTAQAIALAEGDEDDTMVRTALLTTSASAYSKVAGYQMQTFDKEEGDLDGPFTLAATVETEAGGKLFWANFAALTEESIDSYVAGGNSTLFVGCVSWMTGSEAVVYTGSKSMQSESLVVNAAAGNLLGLGYIILLPLALIVIGIAVTILRRRK